MSSSLLLCFAAFFAGMVDAIGGGGGLIQVPALFSFGPNVPPATLFGTNKLASIWGTSMAAMRYSSAVKLEWSAALPSAIAAFIFAFIGAFAITHVPGDWVRKALPFVLIAIAIHTIRAKNFGLNHAPTYRGRKEKFLAIVTGSAIGFYDGFFGPGTGSFLIFLFVRFFGFDFLRASVTSKLVNVACNGAALLWFVYSGHVMWKIGLVMAGCNAAGSVAGARLAIRHGSTFVRKIFLFVVCLLIVKTAYQALFTSS
jgi:hypothetical protein